MDAFLVATGIVGLAEIGDKTQLLAFLLAARFRRPLPIVAGIFVATLLNHAFAAAVGALVSELLGPSVMRWVLGLYFLGMAVWTMIPDEVDETEASLAKFGNDFYSNAVQQLGGLAGAQFNPASGAQVALQGSGQSTALQMAALSNLAKSAQVFA